MKSRGFTLVEVVIVIAMVGVLMVALLGLFLNNGKLFNYQTELIKTTSTSRAILSEMSKNALQASRVLQNQVVNGTSYTSGITTVVFQLPAFDSSGNSLPNTYDYVVFSANGNVLTEDIQAAASSTRKTITKNLSTSISAIQFTYDDLDWTKVKNVVVDFTNSATYRSQTIDQRIQGVLHLRNY